MSYEDYLIREAQAGDDRWCSQCERVLEDCVCEELCDALREQQQNSGGEVCVPALPESPLAAWIETPTACYLVGETFPSAKEQMAYWESDAFMIGHDGEHPYP